MNSSALTTWKRFHWLFFMNTQALLVCFRQIEILLNKGDHEALRQELQTAAKLLRASGSSMIMAGSFSRDDYETMVRPSMSAPNIAGDDFSGLMSWDHAALIQSWRGLSPSLKSLSPELRSEHEGLLDAYHYLAKSHREVCARFGGDEGGSLRTKKSVAVNILDQFEKRRSNHLSPAPNGGCPMNH